MSAPTAYARLVRRVIATFEETSEHVVGNRSAIGGLGDPAQPFCGYCPICERGIVAVEIVGSSSKPTLRVHSCSAGCPHTAVVEALR